MDSDLKNKTANATNITAFLIRCLLAANVIFKVYPLTPDFILIKEEKRATSCRGGPQRKRPRKPYSRDALKPYALDLLWEAKKVASKPRTRFHKKSFRLNLREIPRLIKNSKSVSIKIPRVLRSGKKSRPSGLQRLPRAIP